MTLLLATASLFAAAAHATDIEPRQVRFRIERHGLQFTAPCSARFYQGNDGESQLALEHPDVEAPATLPAGRYDVLVSCASTEGVLTRGTTVDLRRGAGTIRLRLAPAFLLVRVLRDGKEVAADIVIQDEERREVQRGRDKMALPVPPGSLHIIASVNVGEGSRPLVSTRTVTTREGHKSVETFDTSDGSLVVFLRENGKAAAGACVLRLPKTRTALLELRVGQEQRVPPGTYEVVTQLESSHDFREGVRRNVVVRPGKTTRVYSDHVTGRLSPRVTEGGRPLDDDRRAVVELFLSAAPDPFNTLAPGDDAVLAPGTYRVMARLDGAALDDGTAPSAETKVRVSANARTVAPLDLDIARLEVRASVGGAPRPLAVSLLRGGAEVPVAASNTDDAGLAVFRLPSGNYRTRVTLRLPQGDISEEAPVRLRSGSVTRHRVNLALGAATVQVFEDGVAVSAKVQFFRAGAAAPALVVGAGEEAWLPPGRYSLSVLRKGEDHAFAELQVVEGRHVERQLELLVTSDDTGGAP
ncbi:MAG: hypothetical protein ACO3JL_13225 [Myxococcota bacterium]